MSFSENYKLYFENTHADENILVFSLEDFLVCIIKQESWVELLQQLLSLSIFKMAGEKMTRLESKIEQLHFKSSEERLKFLLKDLTDRLGKNIGKWFKKEIKLGVTHNDIASLTGLSRQRNSMLLKQMEKDDIITYDRRRILVKNYSALS